MARREIEGTLLLAVPTTQEEFASDTARLSDFLLHNVGLDGNDDAAWARYAPYASLCAAVIKDAASRGIRVIRRATLTDLAAAVGEPGVTTLVAHAAGTAVEFADGLWDQSEIDRALPLELADTLDLTVCRSRGLAECLRRRRPTGVILANRDVTDLKVRLALYRQTVAFAADRGVTYTDAAHSIREFLRKGTHR
jgi:hypothetical protein